MAEIISLWLKYRLTSNLLNLLLLRLLMLLNNLLCCHIQFLLDLGILLLYLIGLALPLLDLPLVFIYLLH